jgi:hypothetical protein
LFGNVLAASAKADFGRIIPDDSALVRGQRNLPEDPRGTNKISLNGPVFGEETEVNLTGFWLV